eukprot:scaffold316324_cov35-Tisochrysis_lutea.AAC.1
MVGEYFGRKTKAHAFRPPRPPVTMLPSQLIFECALGQIPPWLEACSAGVQTCLFIGFGLPLLRLLQLLFRHSLAHCLSLVHNCRQVSLASIVVVAVFSAVKSTIPLLHHSDNR